MFQVLGLHVGGHACLEFMKGLYHSTYLLKHLSSLLLLYYEFILADIWTDKVILNFVVM